MAVREFKKKPVIYTNIAEGREALWKSLKSSYSRKSVPQTKKSRPVRNLCDSSQYEYQCNGVGNNRKNHSAGEQSLVTVVSQQPPQVTPQTSDDSTTTSTSSMTSMSSSSSSSSSMMKTPPPPPPLQSPPPLVHRSAGQHSWSSTSSADVYRLRRRSTLVHAICWPDDDETSCKKGDDNDGSDAEEERHDDGVEEESRDSAAEEEPSDSATEEEPSDSAPEEEPRDSVAAEEEPDENDGLSRESANEDGADDNDDGTVDWDAEVIVTPRTQLRTPLPEVTGSDQLVFKFFSPISFIPGSSETDGDRTTTVENDDNDPTIVFDHGDDDQRFSNYTGVRRLCYDDDIVDNDGPKATVSDNVALSKYEMRVKEVDENILFYSKRFLCAVMFFVLLRIFF